jgi:3-dehydroquinate synthetase
MQADKKKRAGRLRFVLPVAIGDVRVFDDVSEEGLRLLLGKQPAVSFQQSASSLPRPLVAES